MFENKMINGIHITRYIASWVRMGGRLETGSDYVDFREWLSTLGINKEDVDQIAYIAANGKLELENSAKKFLSRIDN